MITTKNTHKENRRKKKKSTETNLMQRRNHIFIANYLFSSAGQSDSEKVYLPDSSFLLGCVVGSVFTHRICISIPQKALVISLGTN